jgi:hypothetical protein
VRFQKPLYGWFGASHRLKSVNPFQYWIVVGTPSCQMVACRNPAGGSYG